ncbi:malto-oligosyltrehalose synthase [Noviherbaspirillum sp. CPCC 100848]|uniref:Malto-oligosyltrehalose synthase n=1 Tax=Noviherbaspirillum album TaxID=3080276 RepID=A0ABU6J1R1_9BURK|nr:malto-oligosyltrehalose synthase [Noviherbaspirillum sp. CPCC 100848]MEC4717529.1 malto-oligosyltrehalose synthase [Noviherbaspirillum sp. CPCC 100848]
MSIPRATARLQLHKDFTFDQAAEVVPYYASLGISHIYASPILTARSGSNHGYDIVDPTRINPELGGEEGFRRMVRRVREAGMGLILDIVPNHMGVGPENPWWQHVLEWGRTSPYARWFDIDWNPADETLQGKVMAPFLGQPYGEVLASGQIKLQFDELRGKFFASYYSHRFPISPAGYADLLKSVDSARLAPAIAAFEEGRDENGDITQQNADVGFGLLRELGHTPEGTADIAMAINNYSAAAPQGIEALHALLERQHYRLAWWRCAADGINWRRFFEVTDLAGVRVEQDDVFEATHAQIFRLYTEGLIDGVRIDHVDGLADPGAYCRKLRRRLQALTSQRPPELPPAPAYIIVEKILAPDEQLRSNWEIDGTSGYDFMDRVGALLHDGEGKQALTELWCHLTDHQHSFDEEVRQARRQLLASNLSGEFEAASRALHAVARTDLRTRDYSLGAIRRVFAELLVHFPVYRTYADSNGRDELDQQVIDRALECARQSVDRNEGALLDVIARWLGGDAPRDSANPRVRALHQRAITRFQQLTPPLSAKSVEDTAFYRYGRLLSRNEVGSDPAQFFIPAQEFHEANRIRAERFPYSMLATATHDHKRGEDVRTRIAAFSEIPEEWCRTAREWMQLNAPLRTELPADDAGPAGIAPHPADELMLYQMLAGAWPVGLQPDDAEGLKQFAARIEAWQTKALREAKQVSDWVMPNEAYEAACRNFLHAVLTPGEGNRFLPELAAWVQTVAPAGMIKSLAQTLLRMTSPGVPDLYQGTDFWDFSLVDPDNRRPVDYAARRQTLERIDAEGPGPDAWDSGAIKQHVVARTLRFRAREPELFMRGDYQALQMEGPLAAHAIAFARRHQGKLMVVVAAHLPCRLLGGERMPELTPEAWQETAIRLPQNLAVEMRDVLGGHALAPEAGRLLLSQVLKNLPVALLFAGEGAGESMTSPAAGAASAARIGGSAAADSKDATVETEEERAGPT